MISYAETSTVEHILRLLARFKYEKHYLLLKINLGVAVGFVLPPMLVRASGTIPEIAADLRLMFYLIAGFTSVLFSSRPLPPRHHQPLQILGNSLDSNFLLSLKKLITNRNYVLLLISYGLNVGTFYAISTLLNQVILTYYPGANVDAGRIGLVIVVAGMAGSVVCGLILDKTHRFKETTLSVYAASVVGMLIFTFTLDCGYIAVVLHDWLLACRLRIRFGGDLPEPEGTTSGILNAVVQIFGIVTTLLYEWMLGTVGDRWSNLTLCGLLALGTAITAAIRSDLRRQAAQNNAKE
ncbi:hypothetical protein HW555_003447 [Spodoptera exigua]|uniref:Uncharacterized protein n=1 Tax=Spodoptera exigua TaxID=7107 RepID=A0A835GMS9_SPOEX|nr:hypothetical protein HW555_003447 [Spodoptera exigua]